MQRSSAYKEKRIQLRDYSLCTQNDDECIVATQLPQHRVCACRLEDDVVDDPCVEAVPQPPAGRGPDVLVSGD